MDIENINEHLYKNYFLKLEITLIQMIKMSLMLQKIAIKMGQTIIKNFQMPAE